MILAVAVHQAVAAGIAVVVLAGFVLYGLANIRKARPEIGSEIELAPNRKPYLDDEALEGPKLERALSWGLVSLVIIGVGLPLYWLTEPGRQSGAVENFDEAFAHQGAELFAPTSEGGFNCAGCHGGMSAIGGEVPFTLTDPVTDEIRQVSWKAPPLNDVMLRMTEDQVRFVLIYGRPFSPMPAWGLEGGGPMNEQQIDNLIHYMKSITISREEAKAQAEETAREELERLRGQESEGVQGVQGGQGSGGVNQQATLGAALFNLHCARCHTFGWSYDEPEAPGSGAYGPPLYNVLDQFPAVEDHIDFVTNGAELGEQYGENGQSTGRMPFFGSVLTEEQIRLIVQYERRLAEQVERAGEDT